jgi:hypothetical protein
VVWYSKSHRFYRQLSGVTGAIIKKGEKRGEGEEEEKGRKKKREKRKKRPKTVRAAAEQGPCAGRFDRTRPRECSGEFLLKAILRRGGQRCHCHLLCPNRKE